MTAQKVMFAALPLRALGDTRLSALELRVLGCVAFHDRMSAARGKGQGAWASNETLARRVQCHYTNLSSAITKLAKLGYIEREQHPLNKRLRVYRVVYEDGCTLPDALPDDKVLADASELVGADGEQAVDGEPPMSRDIPALSRDQNGQPIVGRSANQSAPIVCLASENPLHSQGHEPVEYISLSDVRDSAEAGENTHVNMRAAEAARGLPRRVIYRDGEPLHETLAKFERDWKADWTRYRGNLAHWRDWLAEASTEAAGEDNVLSGWAMRLSEQVSYLGWEMGELEDAA